MPLLVKTSNGALSTGAPLLTIFLIFFSKLVMAHHTPGVPLVMWPIMAYLYLVRHCYIAVAHHIHGAPLMSILAIAVFLVVHIPLTMRSCNSRIPEKYLMCYQMSLHNWMIIKVLYRYLGRCLLSWRELRLLGFVTLYDGEVSLAPLGNTASQEACKQSD